MTPYRNEPCPCGSGRKYKNCCLERERKEAATPAIRPEIHAAAAGAAWEADLLPFPFVEESRSKGGAVVSLITAGGFVLHSDIFDQPGPEPFHVAAALAERVRAAITNVGTVPTQLRVGDAEVASLLAPLLSGNGIRAIEAGAIPEVAEAARAMFRHIVGEDAWPPAGVKEAWRHWGRTGEEVAALFRAAAAFHRAAPWKVLSGDRLLGARTPSGRRWALSVMGAGGQEFGLALYSEVDDFLVFFEGEDPRGAWARQKGRQYGLTFTARADLPRSMQKEVAAAGWEVTEPNAYPVLISARSPGGGVCAADWADLVALLGAVARVVVPGLEWEDPGHQMVDEISGISFLLMPDLGECEDDLAPLMPGGAEGPGAEPEAALDGDPSPHPDVDVLSDFRLWLVARGLSSTTVDRHMRNAGLFLTYLCSFADVPLRAVHEFDLREYVFDFIHRKTALPATVVRAAPASLGKFFRFLAETRGIWLPSADEVLGDKDWFAERMETCPGGAIWDEATQVWLGDLTLDLYSRVMLPSEALGEDDEWGERMGPVEWDLHRELRRRWLLWRDELVREGVSSPGALRAELEGRQRQWETTSNERAGGRTPVDAVRIERESLPVS